MFLLRGFPVLATVLSVLLLVQAADKYTDENRPYEFGFTIDGEQHRHEKKDDRGLIMGEYGFITADGVYHVTVYATDENGNFKIISMKNIRVKPYPTSPSRQGQSLPFPPSQQAPITQGPSSQQKPGAGAIEQSPAAPVKTCSSCSIPTTTTPRPQLTDIAVVSKDNPAYNDHQSIDVRVGDDQDYPQQNYPQQNYLDNNPQYPQQNYPDEYNNQQNYPEQNYPQDNYPNQPGSQNYPEGGSQNYPGQGDTGSPNYPQPGAGGQDYPQSGSPQDYPGQGSPQYPGQNGPSGDRNPKQFDVSQQDKPQLVYAQMQVVDRNTDVNYRGPGEREGLPNGITKQDMKHLLYTFNYTVAFHGHHEDGYSDGSKVGYYFVTGRNGVRTRVDYVADEKGFRPKISQEVLDLLSEDVPKPETERDEKYGLKGYEFKWLYYPVDSKRR